MTGVQTCALPISLAVARAEGVGWRGDGTGRYPDARPALEWGNESHVQWRTPTASWSNATPVVIGERVFITVEPATLLGLSLADGKILWEKTLVFADLLSDAEKAEAAEMAKQYTDVEKQLQAIQAEEREALKGWDEVKKLLKENAENAEAQAKDKTFREAQGALRERMNPLRGQLKTLAKFRDPPTHGINGYVSSTPVSDGKRLFVLYGTGIAAAYDLDGNRLWARRTPRPTHDWGHSASPALVGGRLILHVAGEILALNPDNGEPVWTVKGGNNWGSPLAARVAGEDVIVTGGGDLVKVADGTIVARQLVNLPWGGALVQDGVVYACDENGARATRLPDALAPDLKLEPLWTATPKKDRYYASPTCHEGLLYVLNQRGFLTVLDAQSGQTVYERDLQLGGTAFPSPVLAGNRLLFSSDSGKTVILEAGREGKELGRNQLDGFRSTPVPVGERLLIRTLKSVVCIAP